MVPGAPEMVPGVVSNLLRGPETQKMSGDDSLMKQVAAPNTKNLSQNSVPKLNKESLKTPARCVTLSKKMPLGWGPFV